MGAGQVRSEPQVKNNCNATHVHQGALGAHRLTLQVTFFLGFLPAVDSTTDAGHLDGTICLFHVGETPHPLLKESK